MPRLEASLTGANLYGRQSIHGIRHLVGVRRQRRAIHGDAAFVHRSKNGVYDPITHYHVLDAMMRLNPGEEFRTQDFVAYLNETKRQLVWDVTTVGRVLADIAESLYESYRSYVVTYTHRWNGMTYATPSHIEHRTILHNLLEDLYLSAQAVVDAEAEGNFAKRVDSPLLQCPSVMSQLA